MIKLILPFIKYGRCIFQYRIPKTDDAIPVPYIKIIRKKIKKQTNRIACSANLTKTLVHSQYSQAYIKKYK